SIIRGLEAEVRLHDRLLDRFDRRGVERLDREHARLGDVNGRELLQRRRLPVVLDVDAVQQRRRGAACAYAVELLLGRLDGLVHSAHRVLDEIIDHQSAPVSVGVEMSVPTRSPATMRRMLPPDRPKTWIGSLLSMQSERAVVSITLRPRSIASRCVSCGMNAAFGSILGSPS